MVLVVVHQVPRLGRSLLEKGLQSCPSLAVKSLMSRTLGTNDVEMWKQEQWHQGLFHVNAHVNAVAETLATYLAPCQNPHALSRSLKGKPQDNGVPS